MASWALMHSGTRTEVGLMSWVLRLLQQKLMRHSDIVTLNIYGDVVTNEMEQAHSKVVGLALSRA